MAQQPHAPGAKPDAIIRRLAADQHGLVTRSQLFGAGLAAHRIDVHRCRAGARSLRTLIARGSPPLTRSDAESLFLDLVRIARLPTPQSNATVRGYDVDFVWRSERLIVEIDGYAFHCGKAAFERDRRRDAVLSAAGRRVMRVTWQQLSREREALLARLAQALARGPDA